MDPETSTGHQSGAIEQQTEEIEWNGTISVSHKPPTAYKTLNPTQNSTSRGKFGLPRALIFIILLAIIRHQLYGLNFDVEWTLPSQSSRNPPISSNTPLRFVVEYELESPSAKWTSTESTSRTMRPSTLSVSI